ncbi:MAG: hypothetical protein JXR23_04015 [Pontiellaceae bacterium]|nr:hypothetical protein [Pontiellaceae bacterium]
MKRSGWIGLLVFTAGVASAMTIKPDVDNVYKAQARLWVTKPFSLDPITGAQRVHAYDPYYISTQVEIMGAFSVLEEVVNRLNLLEEWAESEDTLSMSQAVKRLRKSVAVKPVRDASIITITAYADNPEEAANIANTYAEVYRDSRRNIADAENRNAISQMEKQWKEQQEIVSEAEDNLNEIDKELQISASEVIIGDEYRFYSDIRKHLALYKYTTNDTQYLMTELLSAQREMIQLESTLRTLMNITDEDLVKTVSAMTDDVTILTAIQRLVEVQADLREAKTQFGEEHPERIRLKNQEEQWIQYLEQRLEGMRLRLQKDYDIAKETYDRLALKLEAAKEQTIEMKVGEKYRPYRKALADLERARAIYDTLGERLRQHLIRTGVPYNSVEIFDRARPEPTPVSSFSVDSLNSTYEKPALDEVAYQLKKSILSKERLEAVLKSGDQASIDAALKDLNEALNEALDAAE